MLTLGELSRRLRVDCEDFLSDSQISIIGDISTISILVYLKSIDFQEHQEQILKEIEKNLFEKSSFSLYFQRNEEGTIQLKAYFT